MYPWQMNVREYYPAEKELCQRPRNLIVNALNLKPLVDFVVRRQPGRRR
jgi:hypothetical protein